ncbi:prolyl oligopeptidase family serine peptidase [Mucilaginibacter boryungensis]|uniref:Prolyl oligopeptidase family serine peptidase n=1 Tax=Mucilaginibacter boryungensis TaxID=768480 RepID=A0ABR9XMK2_9SPHI|nr:prolyl oligopeptidase family serine peptidase [Mucilaginibacter boryungensis]MBE9668445.1 prolyl oligopeptidase family serine peptidase [Mucilaginibacter boryungensis]
MKKIFTLLFVGSYWYVASAQKLEKLTVESIMRDPKWMGTQSTNVSWSEDSKKIYFTWNPQNKGRDAQYEITTQDIKPKLVSPEERRSLTPVIGAWNRKHTLKLIEKNGDIYILDAKTQKETQLTATVEREGNASFSADASKVFYVRGDNYYALTLNTGQTVQLSNFVRGGAATTLPTAAILGGGGRRGGGQGAGGRGAGAQQSGNEQDRWLRNQQMSLFDVLKERAQNDRQAGQNGGRRGGFGNGFGQQQGKHMAELPVAEDKTLAGVTVSPDGRYVTYRLIKQPELAKITIVPNYVTTSGYTEDIPNRTKVGAPQSTSESFVYDTKRDTMYSVNTKDIPGIKDLPDYVKDYPEQLAARTKANEDRRVTIQGPFWNEDGSNAVVIVNAQDYKDRWIMKLDAQTGKLSLIDRQHDNAWIAGPGISSFGSSVGWLDNTHFYFQSEASGYSHIYVADVANGTKAQLTRGKWEVSALHLSNDKKSFYFQANMDHPGVSDYYRQPVTGGTPVKLTSMRGGNEVELSPDEKWLAIRYSYTNKPYELYIQPNKPGAKPVQVTNSVTEEFKSYPWRAPEIFTFKNRDGADIYARVYTPANPAPSHPAVVFVHGAGYLQDVMYKWSTSYFHEYMFNNMLADNGYTVLEIDYTGSAGYGRDIRTGIYRHMGGKDLTDHIDAVKLLVDKYGVNPKNVGIYGGSYGGFMTLMAMFTAPDVFAAGAGLRSVTDWAHYNHGYTANILNEPYNDEKAYQVSSPINFAAGLKGKLLMCHGMVDQNVNFQDIVRLTQRLIELHKDNWSLAAYPVEDHGFVEPSSWVDEYKRIYALFNESLKN